MECGSILPTPPRRPSLGAALEITAQERLGLHTVERYGRLQCALQGWWTASTPCGRRVWRSTGVL